MGKKFTAQCPSEKQVLAGCCPAGATRGLALTSLPRLQPEPPACGSCCLQRHVPLTPMGATKIRRRASPSVPHPGSTQLFANLLLSE